MVAEVVVPTAVVLIMKFAVVAPPATVALAGTVAAELLLERVTTAPLAGAALLRVTVPVEEPVPVTLAGFRDMLVRAGALIVSVAVCVPLKLPVIVAVVVVPTATVVTENVAVVAPSNT